MYCLLQLYFSVSERLKPKQPLLKLFAIKAVGKYCPVARSLEVTDAALSVFLTFWQATGLGLLITFGFIKNVGLLTHSSTRHSHCHLQTRYMTADDINTGIGAILEDFEMLYVHNTIIVCGVLTCCEKDFCIRALQSLLISPLQTAYGP
jgi:hypothetical protein